MAPQRRWQVLLSAHIALALLGSGLPLSSVSAQVQRHTQVPGAVCPLDTNTAPPPVIPDRGFRAENASVQSFMRRLRRWPRPAEVTLSFWVNADGSLDPCGIVAYQESDSLWTAEVLSHLHEVKFKAPVSNGRLVRDRISQRFGAIP
jgi:hypothetical protein